jgi:UDPglucose 6-dehydrogenase
MKIAVAGTGYVGLVTGTCLAETGNDVICVDCDRKKIDVLNRGHIPIYEPGLAELVARNVAGGRLRFTADLPSAVKKARLVFLQAPRRKRTQDLGLWSVVDRLRAHPLLIVVRARCQAPPGGRRLNELSADIDVATSSSRRGWRSTIL